MGHQAVCSRHATRPELPAYSQAKNRDQPVKRLPRWSQAVALREPNGRRVCGWCLAVGAGTGNRMPSVRVGAVERRASSDTLRDGRCRWRTAVRRSVSVGGLSAGEGWTRPSRTGHGEKSGHQELFDGRSRWVGWRSRTAGVLTGLRRTAASVVAGWPCRRWRLPSGGGRWRAGSVVRRLPGIGRYWATCRRGWWPSVQYPHGCGPSSGHRR